MNQHSVKFPFVNMDNFASKVRAFETLYENYPIMTLYAEVIEFEDDDPAFLSRGARLTGFKLHNLKGFFIVQIDGTPETIHATSIPADAQIELTMRPDVEPVDPETIAREELNHIREKLSDKGVNPVHLSKYDEVMFQAECYGRRISTVADAIARAGFEVISSYNSRVQRGGEWTWYATVAFKAQEG